MLDQVVVSRYVKAYVSVVTAEKKPLEVYDEFVQLVTGIMAQKEAVGYFSNPAVLIKDKLNVLDSVLKEASPHKLNYRMLYQIIKNNRFALLKYIVFEIRKHLYEALGMVEVQLTVPAPLSDSMKKRFIEVFKKKTGKEVVLSVKEDKSIIGGVVARMGSVLIDGSYKTNLMRIKEKLSGELQ